MPALILAPAPLLRPAACCCLSLLCLPCLGLAACGLTPAAAEECDEALQDYQQTRRRVSALSRRPPGQVPLASRARNLLEALRSGTVATIKFTVSVPGRCVLVQGVAQRGGAWGAGEVAQACCLGVHGGRRRSCTRSGQHGRLQPGLWGSCACL